MHQKNDARNLLGQEPGWGNRHASAAATPFVATGKAKRHAAKATYRITPSVGDPFRIVVTGRVQWALDRLRAAGLAGCTPVTDPAPRWAAYVHSLRELGVEIETVTETHGGEFAGHHARYVLRCEALPVVEGGAS